MLAIIGIVIALGVRSQELTLISCYMPAPMSVTRVTDQRSVRDGHGSDRSAGRVGSVFVVFLNEIIMQKCYVSTLAKQ